MYLCIALAPLFLVAFFKLFNTLRFSRCASRGHGWLQEELTQILALLPVPSELSPQGNCAQWQRWQEGLQTAPGIGEDMPALRLLLVLDNLSGHHTPEFVMWLCEHGIMPLYPAGWVLA